MKLEAVIEILEHHLDTSGLNEINKILKSRPELKFRLTGEALGHFGFTGQIKSVSEAGIKVHKSNRVVLIRLEDIETLGKPNSREERVARKNSPKPKPVVEAKSKKAKVVAAAADDDDDEWDDEDDDFDDEDDDFDDEDGEFIIEEEPVAKKAKKSKPSAPAGKSGSKFIPVKK